MPDGVNQRLVELVKASGTYVNPCLGGIGIETQENMITALRALKPVWFGQVHVTWRDNPGWDLPATIRCFSELEYDGLYVIEVNSATDPHLVTKGLIDVVLANM